MAKKSFTSHLRENRVLRNDQAKKINGGNLCGKLRRVPVKI
jgi:hypothetical protein